MIEVKFNEEERKRERKAFGPMFVATEIVDEDQKESQEAAIQKLNEQQQEDEGGELIPRIHPADVSRDYKSLDRKGRRNLYLLLLTKENEKDVWRFPQGGVEKGELLHQVIAPFIFVVASYQRCNSLL